MLRGNATKIDALLMREYLYRGQSVPRPGPPSGVAGGYTAVFYQGVARDVLHADVTSLYPSIMLSQGIAPSADRLGIWSSLLADLREFRVSAKRLARTAADPGDRLLLGALQQTFKILINSFYGYLGFSLGHWNDFEAANRVTLEGRRVVMALVDRLRELGGDGHRGRHRRPLLRPAPRGARRGLAPRVARRRPAQRDRARAERTLRGDVQLQDEELRAPRRPREAPRSRAPGFRSRGIELFQRQWMEEVFRLLLEGRREEIPALARRWEESFLAHRVPVRQFMKTETLQESPEAYREKVEEGKRNPAAPYELALAAERSYQAGDQVSYYVAGGRPVKVSEAAKLATAWDPSAPDENTAHYIAKLRDLYEKFRPFIERDGLRAPTEDDAQNGPVQLTLDLQA